MVYYIYLHHHKPRIKVNGIWSETVKTKREKDNSSNEENRQVVIKHWNQQKDKIKIEENVMKK